MSRVRFMSPYLKGGQNAAKLSNRVRYIAARPGVEVLSDEQRDLPATKKQESYIRRILRDFPGAEELLEYDAGQLVRGLKQMGITRQQALEVVDRLWDRPESREEERE